MMMQHPHPPQVSPAQHEFVSDPTDNDVLLGRGVSTNRHPGNVSFRNLVGQHVVRFCLICNYVV